MMASADENTEGGKGSGTSGNAGQVQLEMAQRQARETLRDDHRAFEVSLRNSRG
jgi:hypothetical protein